MNKIIFLLFISTLHFTGYAQDTKTPSGTIEFVSNELSGIINKDAKVEVIADGFQFTEGPLWIEKDQMLLLSDVPGNTIYKWTEAKGREIFVKPGGYTDTAKRGGFMGPDGLVLTRDGKLLVAQHGDRRIAMLDAPLGAPQSKFLTLAGAYNGKRLNSPNDLYLTPGGDIYFTDPSYGLERGGRDPKKELPYQGVYRINKAGEVTLLIDSISSPNGISVYKNGKKLIVSNSDNRIKRWYTYDMAKDGSLSNGKLFYDVSNEKGSGLCDGLKLDKYDNLFATGPGGLWIFSKAGKLIGKINITGATPSNCAITPDNKTLFITANSWLLRVKMK